MASSKGDKVTRNTSPAGRRAPASGCARRRRGLAQRQTHLGTWRSRPSGTCCRSRRSRSAWAGRGWAWCTPAPRSPPRRPSLAREEEVRPVSSSLPPPAPPAARLTAPTRGAPRRPPSARPSPCRLHLKCRLHRSQDTFPGHVAALPLRHAQHARAQPWAVGTDLAAPPTARPALLLCLLESCQLWPVQPGPLRVLSSSSLRMAALRPASWALLHVACWHWQAFLQSGFWVSGRQVSCAHHHWWLPEPACSHRPDLSLSRAPAPKPGTAQAAGLPSRRRPPTLHLPSALPSAGGSWLFHLASSCQLMPPHNVPPHRQKPGDNSLWCGRSLPGHFPPDQAQENFRGMGRKGQPVGAGHSGTQAGRALLRLRGFQRGHRRRAYEVPGPPGLGPGVATAPATLSPSLTDTGPV